MCEYVRVGERQTEALYIFTRLVIRKPCLQEPPNTKCVWVAASEDKMAISTISQPKTVLLFANRCCRWSL